MVIRSRKADGASLLAWLAYADPTLDALKCLGTVPDLSDDAGFGSLVARIFCVETWRAIQATGLIRTYHRREIQSAVLRGRIDFARLARGGGDLSRTPCIVFARLPQTPLNRLLSAAARRVERDPELRRAAGAPLGALAAMLAEVPPTVDTAALGQAIELSRLERPFAVSVALARLLLRSGGLGSGDGLSSPAFLVNLANLFERTIVRAFLDSGERAAPGHPVRVARIDGTAAVDISAPMRIDLFLSDQPGGPIVVDAKYKYKISASNLHQMVSYCWATGARRAVLVVPRGAVSDRRRIEIEGAGEGVVRIHVMEIDLGERTLGGWHRAGRDLVEAVVGAH